MQTVLWVGIAGLIGTLARYGLATWADQRLGGTFPTGTVLVNLAGCLAIGFLFHTMDERYVVDPTFRAAVVMGLLGGFTTFSSFGLQTFVLIRNGDLLMAALNVAVSNVAGLCLVWVGYTLSRSL